MSLRAVAFLVAASATMGCSSAEVEEGTYVARLTGSDAWVSVVIEGEAAVAYSCGGAESLEQQTRWMAGTVDGAAIALAGEGWALELEEDEGLLSGALEGPGGERFSVDTDAVFEGDRPEDLRGLFTAVVDGCRAGVIIDEDGAVRGAFCTEAGFLSQVTPVMPVQQTPDGIPVEAEGPTGVRSFAVRPVDVAAVHAEVAADGG